MNTARHLTPITAALAIVLSTAGLLPAVENALPLVRLDETQAATSLVSIDSSLTVEFRQGDQKLQVPATQFIRWGSLGELRSREAVVLREGSLLGGSIRRIDRNGIRLEHDVFDPLTIARDQLRGVVLRRPAARLAYDRLLIRLSQESFPLDTLLLENGDTLRGKLLSLPQADDTGEQQTLPIETEAARFDMPLERIAAVVYASPAASPVENTRLQMGLRGGDLLQVESLSAQGRSVNLELNSGLKLATAPDFLWPDVTYLHGSNPAWKELSSLDPLSYRHLPLLGWETPLGVNRNVLGGRLRSGGHVYRSGLAMPGSSRVAFRLDGKYRQLQAELALDDAASLRGSVVFRIYTRQASEPLEQVYESELIRGGEPPTPLRLDVTDATLLVLLVDHADRGEELDYANWLDAMLVVAE